MQRFAKIYRIMVLVGFSKDKQTDYVSAGPNYSGIWLILTLFWWAVLTGLLHRTTPVVAERTQWIQTNTHRAARCTWSFRRSSPEWRCTSTKICTSEIWQSAKFASPQGGCREPMWFRPGNPEPQVSGIKKVSVSLGACSGSAGTSQTNRRQHSTTITSAVPLATQHPTWKSSEVPGDLLKSLFQGRGKAKINFWNSVVSYSQKTWCFDWKWRGNARLAFFFLWIMA